jgi:hypothetical protein
MNANVKLRSVAEAKRPGVKKLIAEVAKLNRKDPPSGMMVGKKRERLERETGRRNEDRVRQVAVVDCEFA